MKLLELLVLKLSFTNGLLYQDCVLKLIFDRSSDENRGSLFITHKYKER